MISLEIPSTPWLALLALGVFTLYQLQSYLRSASDAPIVGKMWLSLLSLGNLNPMDKAVVEAYNKYSKKHLPFRLAEKLYVVPPSVFSSVRKMPSSKLNAPLANEDFLQIAPFLGPEYMDLHNIVSIDITRSINNFIPSIQEEARLALLANFSDPALPTTTIDSKIWTSTPAHPKAVNVITRISTRIFVGKKFTLNAAYIHTTATFARTIVLQSMVLQNFWDAVIALIAPFTPTAFSVRTLKKAIRPDIEYYLAHPDSKAAPPDTEPVILSQMTRAVASLPAYADQDPEKIIQGVSSRLLGLTFASIDTTSGTLTQLLHDLVSHDPSIYAIPIAKQARSVLAANSGVWTTKALGDLTLLDSFVKESQRLHSIGLTLPSRKVMTPGGVTLSPSPEAAAHGAKDVFVPQGAILQFPSYAVDTDAAHYPDPFDFQGFRHAETPTPSSSPSDTFLAFGHGRNACPGRFLALTFVKLSLLEFLALYEYAPIPRPPDWTLSLGLMPSMSVPIYVRRKEVVGS